MRRDATPEVGPPDALDAGALDPDLAVGSHCRPRATMSWPCGPRVLASWPHLRRRSDFCRTARTASRRQRRAFLAIAAAVCAAACIEPMVPNHDPTYPFADQFGDVFHWPGNRLPVRFYAEPRGNLRALLTAAVDAWQQQFLYGEFSGTIVSDSTVADVIVRWADSVPPDAPPDNGPAVKACGGVTQGVLDSSGTSFAGPFETQIQILTGTVFTAGQVQACVARTTIHEMGHALGLLQESPDSLRDIMATTPKVNQPSDGDRRTVEALYHTPSTLGPPPR